VKSLNFVGTKFRGLTTLDTFVDCWISGFQTICNITKANKCSVGILNLWIAIPTKYSKLNVQWILMISQKFHGHEKLWFDNDGHVCEHLNSWISNCMQYCYSEKYLVGILNLEFNSHEIQEIECLIIKMNSQCLKVHNFFCSKKKYILIP